jgi:RNA polymerase sigma-54 factor
MTINPFRSSRRLRRRCARVWRSCRRGRWSSVPADHPGAGDQSGAGGCHRVAFARRRRPGPEEADSLGIPERDRRRLARPLDHGRKILALDPEDEERRQRIYDSIVAPVTCSSTCSNNWIFPWSSRTCARPRRRFLAIWTTGASSICPPRSSARLGSSPLDERAQAGAVLRSRRCRRGRHPESLLLQLERKSGKNASNTRSCAITWRISPASAIRRSPRRWAPASSAWPRPPRGSAASRPIPGGDFNPTGNPYILPDVVIERGDDGRLDGAPHRRAPAEPCASMIFTRT